jgi:hypothetical protein
MKIPEIVVSWVFAVIVGSLICGLFSNIMISLIFAIFSGVLSLPYLILMILIGRKKMSFLALQAIHLGLALATGAVIILFENNFARFFYVLFLYFLLGLAAQAYFYFRSPFRVEDKREDLLDF